MTREQAIELLRARVPAESAGPARVTREDPDARAAHDAAVAEHARRGVTSPGQLEIHGRNAAEAVIVAKGRRRQLPEVLAKMLDPRRKVPTRIVLEWERDTRGPGGVNPTAIDSGATT